MADVGLVGLPNAGKSTLIQALTNVRPKIANYAFTTLTPNLGVMEWKGRSLVIEDVPGLIEGASEGKGLGFQFLKHIDRCRAIIHLLDVTEGEEAVIQNYETIRRELENWGQSMAEKEEIIVFSKADIVDAEHLAEIAAFFEKKTKKRVAMTISAGAFIRIDDLKNLLIERIPERPKTLEATEAPSVSKQYDLKKSTNPKAYTITRMETGDFRVTGERIEEIARMTDTRYPDGVGRVYDVMDRLGIMRKIREILRQEILAGEGAASTHSGHMRGFFEGEEDFAMPSVWIGEKAFSLDGLIFMREGR